MSFKYKEREVNKTLKTVFLHITDELPCATTFSLRASGLGPGSALGKKGEKNRPAKRAERRLLRSPIFFLFDPVFCLFALFPPLRNLVPGYGLLATTLKRQGQRDGLVPSRPQALVTLLSGSFAVQRLVMQPNIINTRYRFVSNT